jgi:hypothetical protein
MRTLAGVLLVLLAVVIGIGVYREWFTFVSKPNPADDQKVTLGVDVDKTKIREDTSAAEKKTRELADEAAKKAKEAADAADKRAKSLVEEQTASGTIEKIDMADNRIAVMIKDNKELTVQVVAGTKIQRKDELMDLKDLHAGDHVAIVYVAKDGKNVAKSITVERATE